MNNDRNDPALTDGAAASLPTEQPFPAPEDPLAYALVRKTRVHRYANEEIGVTHELVPDRAFFTKDVSAHEASRNILAADGPIVIRIPPGYRLVRSHEEFRAAKHLRAIRALVTGKDEPFQIEEDMIAVVEICRRVFHAYRTLRETSLKAAITEALHKASTKELFGFARALSVLPEEFKDDPFDDREQDPRMAQQASPRGRGGAGGAGLGDGRKA